MRVRFVHVAAVAMVVMGRAAAGAVGDLSGGDAPVVMLELVTAGPAAAVGGGEASLQGRLASITAADIRLTVSGEEREVPIVRVRRLVCAGTPAAGGVSGAGAAAAGGVSGAGAPASGGAADVWLVGGGRLEGDAFRWTGDTARLERQGQTATLPIDLVEMVSWTAPGPRAGERPQPAWIEVMPERPDGDVVVVHRGEGVECVECAVLEVTDDEVIVMLDGERIPVKRERIAGVRWLRPAEAPSGGLQVRLAGGAMTAATVTWGPERLVLDERVILPPRWLHSIDYAAGRTVPLSSIDPEQIEAESLLRGAAAHPRLAAFFAPRRIPAADGAAGDTLLVRPRTRAVWRVPPDSRAFRAQVVAETGPMSLVIMVDDREPQRHLLAASRGAAVEMPIEVDVAGGRRLTLVLDLPGDDGAAGGLGGPVRIVGGAFEK